MKPLTVGIPESLYGRIGTCFAELIASKVEARHIAGDLDNARYQEIAPRLQALTKGESHGTTDQ